jgi:hypothetical protein
MTDSDDEPDTQFGDHNAETADLLSDQTKEPLDSGEDAKRRKRIESFRRLAKIAGMTMTALLVPIVLIGLSVADADSDAQAAAGMVAGLFFFPLLGAWAATMVGLTGIAVTPGIARQRLISAGLAVLLLAPVVWLAAANVVALMRYM